MPKLPAEKPVGDGFILERCRMTLLREFDWEGNGTMSCRRESECETGLVLAEYVSMFHHSVTVHGNIMFDGKKLLHFLGGFLFVGLCWCCLVCVCCFVHFLATSSHAVSLVYNIFSRTIGCYDRDCF